MDLLSIYCEDLMISVSENRAYVAVLSAVLSFFCFHDYLLSMWYNYMLGWGIAKETLMGFYFRKSKSFGPFRVNFSKSGIGVSAGVKGARVSVGPRGTYLNAGRHGLFYRKKIGGHKRSGSRATASSRSKSAVTQARSAVLVSNSTLSKPANVDYDFVMSPGTIGRTIVSAVKKARIFRILWLCVFIVCSLFAIWNRYLLVGSGALVLFRLLFNELFTVFIDFELYDKDIKEWENFANALEIFGRSAGKWEVKPGWLITIPPASVGAVVTVKRKKHGRILNGVIKTPDEFIAIESSSVKVIFMPQIVVVSKGLSVAIFAYDELQIECDKGRLNFGTTKVPCDVKIVDYSYEHMTKDGLPDRRYNSNMRYSIGEVAVLSIKNSLGTNILFAGTNGCSVPILTDAGRNYRPKIVFASADSEKKDDLVSEKTVEPAIFGTIKENPVGVIRPQEMKKTNAGNRLLSEILNNTTEGE